MFSNIVADASRRRLRALQVVVHGQSLGNRFARANYPSSVCNNHILMGGGKQFKSYHVVLLVWLVSFFLFFQWHQFIKACIVPCFPLHGHCHVVFLMGTIFVNCFRFAVETCNYQMGILKCNPAMHFRQLFVNHMFLFSFAIVCFKILAKIFAFQNLPY